MRFAIDRFAIGTESEVAADDFDGLTYIPSRKTRFYCPECNEIVYFRAKGGSHPNQFYHQEKIDGAPECDRRVDGRSGLSLNERIGLPMYLATLVPGEFQLNIGFPALGEELLKRTALSNYSVEISSDSNVIKIKIDSTNFIEDSVTLVPVNFIPENGSNYSITISGDKSLMGLRRKWSDYADGFEFGGAIFSDDGMGGKKVRRGDSISTHKSYLAVLRKKIPSYYDIQQEFVGNLRVGKDTFGVYRISVNVSIDDQNKFSSISSYLKSCFGVWLLECLPELIPVWPPVVQNDCFVPVKKNTSLVCSVSSKGSNPNVFVYSDYGVSKINVNNEYGVRTVEVSIGSRPVTLSVDRKYVGREIVFSSTVDLPQSSCRYEIEIADKNGEIIPWKNLNKKILSSEFSVISNCKLELYAGLKSKEFRRIAIRETLTCVPELHNTEELYFVVESRIVKQFRCIQTHQPSLDYKDLCQSIRNAQRGMLVPIPRWAWHSITFFRNNHNEEVYTLLMSMTMQGKIYTGVLSLLRGLRLDRNDLKVGE